MSKQNTSTDKDINLDFEVLEANEATALEEMGASSTVGAGSTCSSQPVLH
ncbi:thiopeptide-type bacteriocin [Veronia nyctiphanis]|nr:thiopeptide-type bacteriocin [Veronia nyctiphanis]